MTNSLADIVVKATPESSPPEWKRECAACEGEGKVEHPHMPLHTIRSEAPEYAIVDCEECGGEGWSWTDDPVTLAECRPGPFWFDGSLGFKTEYGMTLPNDMGMWTVTNWPEAYCMESGECFWGGTSKHEDRAKLLVWPVEELSVARTDPLATLVLEAREALAELIGEELGGDQREPSQREETDFYRPVLSWAARRRARATLAKLESL